MYGYVYELLSCFTVATGRSPGDLKELSITDDIFIGGHRGQHNYP